MPVKAITAEYKGESRDRVENFNGQQLLNICWEKHTMFGWPMCVPVDGNMPFSAVIENIIPSIFSSHPEFEKIDWSKAIWTTASGAFIPDLQKSLVDNGLKHKSTIRFRTPDLNGYNGAG